MVDFNSQSIMDSDNNMSINSEPPAGKSTLQPESAMNPESTIPKTDHLKHRIRMEPSYRIPYVMSISFSVGAAAGFTRGWQAGGLRFRAENAHRTPKTERGWYFYHRSKSQVAILEGMRQGARIGTQMGLMTGLFLVLEDQFDKIRGAGEDEGKRDFVSSVLGSTVSAGLISALKRYSWSYTGKALKIGFSGGLVYGIAQDVGGVLVGRHIGYIENIKEFLGSPRSPRPS